MSQFNDVSKTCDNKDCNNESHYIPQLLFFAKGFLHRNAPPMEMSVSLAVCKECTKTMQVSDLVSPEIKKVVEMVCERANIVKPNYKKTKIKFIRILSIPYQLPKSITEDKNE